MKKLLLIAASFIITLGLQAQWAGSTTTSNAIYRYGNVGIGSLNPTEKLEINGWIGRTAHNNGALVGSYNNVGANSYQTNPIYVIGSNYKPAATTLSNMYGIGYTHKNASFISTASSGWGLYVAADGDARIFLNASDGGSSYFNAGNVGIGTTNPRGGLDVTRGDIWLTASGTNASNTLYAPGHVYFIPRNGIAYLQARRSDNTGSTEMQFRTYNNGSLKEAMRIDNLGNVGIGTTTPRGKLDVKGGNIWLVDDQTVTSACLNAPGDFRLVPRANSVSYLQARRGNNSGSTELQIRTWNNGVATEAIRVNSIGNVGIGCTNPQSKLSVNGTINATKVEITVTVPCSDHVFEKDYNLRSLEEVETFVKENKHLPEVPSAAEFKENGYSVGEMDDVLLRKVEELTLYIIEQQKLIEQLQSEVKGLKKTK